MEHKKRIYLISKSKKRNMKIALLTFVIAAAFINASAQTADEVINKYVEAKGGKEKISQVKTLYMEGDMEIMGNTAPAATYIVNGKGYKSELEFNGTKIISVYTDKGGWTINPMAGQSEPTPVAEDLVKAGQINLDASGPLFNYAAKGNKVEMLGKEDSNYKLKVITASNVEMTFFIDTASYYNVKTITKMMNNGQEMEITVENSDFKKTDQGLVMPYAGIITYPGLSINMTQNKVEVNKDIDMAIFEMPKN
jgi:hypothetical protein